MRIYPAISVFLAILTVSPVLSAETRVPSEAYREASRFVLLSRYSEAESVFDEEIGKYSEEPLAYLLKAAVIQYAATDYEDFSREGEFHRLLDGAESLARKKLEENGNDLWARYCVASARCFHGVRLVSEGSFVKGVLRSRSGANGMAEIRSREPRFYDAYLCHGSYRFWKSAAAKSLHVLPFVDDKRDEGLRDVRTAVSRGKLTGPIANTVLLEMLIENAPEAAAELGESLMRSYPECRLFAWQLGEAYKKLNRYEHAVSVFSRLAEEYRRDHADDGSGQVRCWWKLALMAHVSGKREDCRKYSEAIVELAKRSSVANRQAKRIEGAKRFLTELDHERE